MKRENVFENDSPASEMETQTLRPTQQGQHIPFVNGIPVNSYPGAINPLPTSYQQQQPGFVNWNGNPQQMNSQQMAPQFINQVPVQPQPYPYANSYYQPLAAMTPAYIPNALPTPYMTNPYQPLPVPALPFAQGPWTGAPYTQPMQPQLTAIPIPQSNFAPGNFQSSPYLQPAINIADGQYTQLPNQYAQGATKNGSTYSKNGERDFISWNPTVNILETDRTFKIEICVPGVARENCRINVDKNNVLRISGTRRWNQETDAVGFTKKEFNYGSFACSFLLTENMQKEKITSSCRNGLLIISIPKREQNNEGEDRTFSEVSVN